MLEDEGQVATAPPGSCPQCGRVNTPDRRFCGKCGYQLFTPDPRTPPPKVSPPRKRPWWQRWIPERWLPEKELVSGEAKRAFRRQLPVGIRLRRGFGIAGVLALIIGALFVMGTNPVRWVKDRIADSKGSLAVIAGVAATADPVDSPLPTSPASNLVNGDLGAWGTQWAPTGAAPVCVPPGAEGSPASAILTLPGLTEVRALDLTAGLEETNPLRAVQFRPKTVQLAFSDGTCQTVQLEDAPGTQREDITPVVDRADPGHRHRRLRPGVRRHADRVDGRDRGAGPALTRFRPPPRAGRTAQPGGLGWIGMQTPEQPTAASSGVRYGPM